MSQHDTLTQAAKMTPEEIGKWAEYWGELAQQKADFDARRGVSMPVSYYASTVVGALLATQRAQAEPERLVWMQNVWWKLHPKAIVEQDHINGWGVPEGECLLTPLGGHAVPPDDVTEAWCQANPGLSAQLINQLSAWLKQHQEAQAQQSDPIDSMGMPLSCGKPLCAPGDHHPLCKLNEQDQHSKPDARKTDLSWSYDKGWDTLTFSVAGSRFVMPDITRRDGQSIGADIASLVSSVAQQTLAQQLAISDDVIEQVLYAVDAVARKYDAAEYGLPIHLLDAKAFDQEPYKSVAQKLRDAVRQAIFAELLADAGDNKKSHAID